MGSVFCVSALGRKVVLDPLGIAAQAKRGTGMSSDLCRAYPSCCGSATFGSVWVLPADPKPYCFGG